MAVPALPLAAGGELPPDLEEQRLHKLQLQRLAEEMLKRRQSASTEEKLRAQVRTLVSKSMTIEPLCRPGGAAAAATAVGHRREGKRGLWAELHVFRPPNTATKT